MIIIYIGPRTFTNLTFMKRYVAKPIPFGTLNHSSRKKVNYDEKSRNPYDRPEYIAMGSLNREMYCLVNDGGFEMYYPKNCFVTEQEFRDKKLNQILE
jgi:hypothetical protein